jgi:hypothetical protein
MLNPHEAERGTLEALQQLVSNTLHLLSECVSNNSNA